MNMDLGIAYIVTNKKEQKSKKALDTLCNKSIALARKNGSGRGDRALPIAVISCESSETTDADIHIDANPYLDKYREEHNPRDMVLAELLKTYICEWTPFKRTIYMDCDTMIISREFKEYANVLSLGFEISLATCVTMAWKDSVAGSYPINPRLLRNAPPCFPYWNFGVFGSDKENSKNIMEDIRKEFLTYCFATGKKDRMVEGCDAPAHAQPALVSMAMKRSPHHGIFTMPARFNAHFAASGGYVFTDRAVVLHLWKDIREMVSI